MRTSPHCGNGSQILQTFVLFVQSKTRRKSCQDNPHTSNGHLSCKNLCVLLSHHPQFQQGCLCSISVLGIQQIQEKQGSLSIHARSWGVERNHVCNSSMPTAPNLCEASHWLIYALSGACRMECFVVGIDWRSGVVHDFDSHLIRWLPLSIGMFRGWLLQGHSLHSWIIFLKFGCTQALFAKYTLNLAPLLE